METPILIPPNCQLEFHVHIDASLLAIGAMLAHNPIGKYDQPIIYDSRMFNKAKHNYTTIEKEALTMVYALYKFGHFLLGNKFVFYVDHIVRQLLSLYSQFYKVTMFESTNATGEGKMQVYFEMLNCIHS
jgi:hypothetical protein